MALEVRDDKISCFVRGEKVLSAYPSGMSLFGTFGMEVWDGSTMRSAHKVHSLTVTAI